MYLHKYRRIRTGFPCACTDLDLIWKSQRNEKHGKFSHWLSRSRRIHWSREESVSRNWIPNKCRRHIHGNDLAVCKGSYDLFDKICCLIETAVEQTADMPKTWDSMMLIWGQCDELTSRRISITKSNPWTFPWHLSGDTNSNSVYSLTMGRRLSPWIDHWLLKDRQYKLIDHSIIFNEVAPGDKFNRSQHTPWNGRNFMLLAW